MVYQPLIHFPAALALGFGLLAAPLLHAQAPAGQAVVRGTLVSLDDRPVSEAIVELRVRGDSVPVRTGRSGEAGRFQLDPIAEGVYRLVIRRIGFGPATTAEFTVTAGQVRDLGRIRLEPAAVQLAPIEVTVERPDIRFEPDRTGYLVEALTNAAGGVVTDALRELPDLVVDLDGTIRLRGNTPAIYINGKPAPMEGVSLSVFLEQFPADRIDRIEVLEAPSARYGAEGSGGIINIVLKEGVELGLTGNLSLSAGTRGQYSANGRGTLQRGPLTFNAGMDARWSDSRSSDFTLRQNLLADPVTFLRQDASSDRSSRNGGMQLELRYELSKKDQVSARFSGNLNGNDRDGLTATAHLDELELTTLRYDRLARQHGDGSSGQARVAWEHTWVPERHTLEMDASIQRNRNDNRTREETLFDAMYQGAELLPAWLTRREDGSTSNVATLEANYTRPLGQRLRLEAGSGLRSSTSREDQTTSLFEEPGSTFPDEQETRLISRDQRIGSLWLTLQQRFGKFGVSAGLRGEWVNEDIRFPLGELVDRSESRLYPSVNLSWNPRPRMGVRISYSQRVNRPGVSVLDPSNRSTDPLNRSVGNPDIESALTHGINAGFNWAGRLGQLSFGPYWNQTNDGWERVTTVDTAGISTSTWANLTSRETLGAGLGYSAPRVWGWNARINLSASRATLRGSLRPPGADEGKLRWSVGGGLTGPVVQGITAQGNFGYEPGRDLVQGRTSGQWRADFNFRYRLSGNRTTIGLSVQDPFELRKTTQQIRDPSVLQTGRSRVTTRSMTVNLSYAFGGGRGREGGPGPTPVRRD
jgi:outer membrane receptor protein involved in Fe transport